MDYPPLCISRNNLTEEELIKNRLRAKHYRDVWREQGFCINCGGNSGDRLPINDKATCEFCSENIRKFNKRRWDSARLFVLQNLGGCCNCVGQDCWHIETCPVKDLTILSVDHIDKDGKEHRGIYKNNPHRWVLYKKAVITGKPRLQLLCPNCHVKKDTNRTRGMS